MEELYRTLKAFILGPVNAALEGFAGEGCTLPAVEKGAVFFGTLDALKSAQPVLVSVYPESSEAGEEDIGGTESMRHSVTVTFFCRGAPQEENILRTCRYAAAFRKCVREDWTLGGKTENAAAERFVFFPDCGTAERTAAAVEIEMTIRTAE